MANNSVDIRLKGHESFYIREGWLRKGLNAVNADSQIFSKQEAVDELGIGANMVKSLRYWLQVVGLTEEVREAGGKRSQRLTKGFGDLILEYDPYLEHLFTIWLLHYQMTNKFSLATSWYLFFNRFNIQEFNKEILLEDMERLVRNIDSNITFSVKSLHDDCNCVLKTYCLNEDDLRNPEDNLISPFTELKLIKKIINFNKEEVWVKNSPTAKELDKLAVLYVIIDKMNNSKETTIEKLLEEEGNVGKVFNISRNLMNEYLDSLENEGYIKVNRTAGLNTIYINDLNTQDVIADYYKTYNKERMVDEI